MEFRLDTTYRLRVYYQAMNQEQFEFLAVRLRSKQPVATAARLVLLHGFPPAEAARTTRLTIQSLSRTLKAYRALHAEIQRLYGAPTKGLDG